MRIIQMLPVLVFGDAIGNDTLALNKTLLDHGYDSMIYANNIDKYMEKKAKNINEYIPDPNDIILYHLSTGSEMNYKIAQYPGKIVIIYHNITPPYFFEKYDSDAVKVCTEGLEAAKYLSSKAEFCIADSSFNKSELQKLGYHCDIKVLPILIDFDDYKKKPSPSVVNRYRDGHTNIIFTGRVAPNKKHEDIIAAFHYYQKYYNPKSRLILVGRHDFYHDYYLQLQKYIQMLGVSNVIFSGQVKFQDVLAFYSVADAFLCLSEHEGFCVPLVEAMMFDVPIIAYDCCAVGETLGNSGFLLPNKDPVFVAGALNRVIRDLNLREYMVSNQRERLEYFEHNRINKQFIKYISSLCVDK